ncbi:MAG: glycerophosphodiester phosphodiesterase [Acidimicrobiales bacterium]
MPVEERLEEANPWLGRRSLNIAHQGGSREAPSSTIYAMRRALAAGAHGLELDLHATSDGQIVVSHDATVDRTTAGSGAIASLTLAQVKELDPAYWWVPGEIVAPGRPERDYPLRGLAFGEPELRVPALAEVLDAFPGVYLNLDIKQTAPAVPPYEKELARLLRAYGRRDDVIVASFNDEATRSFSAYAPEIATSAGTAATAAFWQSLRAGNVGQARGGPASSASGPARRAQPGPVAFQVPVCYGGVRIVSAVFVNAAHEAGIAVHVWTIDEEELMVELLDIGVDGIITDVPSVCARVLEQRQRSLEDR